MSRGRTGAVAASAGLVTRRSAVSSAFSQSEFNQGNGTQLTQYEKLEIEAPCVSARFIVRVYAYPLTTAQWTFAVAPTEDGRNDTASRCYRPIYGGVASDAPRSTVAPFGWYQGDLVGGNIYSLPADESGGAKVLSFAVSKTFDLPFVPRADPGGILPLLLFRTHKTDNSAVNGMDSPPSGGYTGEKTADAWSRMHRCSIDVPNPTDGIADLTKYPTNLTSAHDYRWDSFLDIDYAVGVRSFWVIHDSTSANWHAQGWAAKAVRSISTPAAPCVINNIAWSGHSTRDYVNLANAMLDAGVSPPTDVIIASLTVNDAPQGAITSSDFRLSKLQRFCLRMKALGSRVYGWDSCPNDGFSALQEDGRIYSQNRFKAWAADGTITKYVEMGKAISTGTYPNRFKPGKAYDLGHPSYPSGVDDMFPVMRDAIRL